RPLFSRMYSLSLFLPYPRHISHLPSFPTRRSSDLGFSYLDTQHRALFMRHQTLHFDMPKSRSRQNSACQVKSIFEGLDLAGGILDRKSTRLNSSHVAISYAVFCLKKKKVWFL